MSTRVDWEMLGRNLSGAPQGEKRSMPRGKMPNVGPAARGMLLAAMAMAIALNLIQLLDTLTENAPYRAYRALHTYETDDPFEVAISHDDTVGSPVAPFYYLGQLFPKSVIVVPDGGVDSWFEFESAAVAFGEATSVQEAEYDPEKFLNLANLRKYRIDAETFVPDEEYAIETVDERVSFYVNGAPSGIVVVLTPEGEPDRYGPIAFVDTSVLDAEGVPTPRVQ